MKYLILFLVSFSAQAAQIPDAKLTPGDIRNASSQELCTTSTKAVRNVPAKLKQKVFAEYGISGNYDGYCNGSGGCEIDHDISLELGGSNSIKNLWPAPYFGSCNAHQKDRLENKLHLLMCKGTITLKQAQTAIRADWRPAYKKYVDSNGCQ